MEKAFSQCEVVELGIQIEKNGVAFYNHLADAAKNPKAGEVYAYLAGEEKKHIEVFKSIFDSVCEYSPSEAYPEEYFSYMKTLAGEYVFTQKDKGVEVAKKAKNDIEAVDLGIKLEEDSIIFYEGMKKVLAERDHGKIDELVKQEQDHLRKLTELKKEIQTQEG
jgi:rubrerythrin